MADRKNWNEEIIEEFRANEGRVGGRFVNTPILLLHHTGAKSGTVRVNPLAYQTDGDRFVIFASKGGAPTNPDWYHNLRANPDATVEAGTDTIPVRARVTEGEERERLWARWRDFGDDVDGFATRRPTETAVVVLEPRA